ncbi:Gfo/Idh/MocA family protein [Paenibacillus sp. GCM10027626]|uniref:Gfo/Idh/MocA family protein n=1 Tax=Paenibacillus sp. GCM10027626 TaxID=3273411 RepID=UPI003630B859
MGAKQPVRMAVAGGVRGSSYIKSMLMMPDKVQLAAVCDLNEAVLNDWTTKVPGIKTYTSFETLMNEPDIDAVLLATPMMLHARQAVQAMQAGKHVLSEVAAAHTIEDCWQLVETAEQTGMIYMMAENFNYFRLNMMVKNMTDQGVFGELTHAETADGYIRIALPEVAGYMMVVVER